jgi:hypothetical protein
MNEIRKKGRGNEEFKNEQSEERKNETKWKIEKKLRKREIIGRKHNYERREQLQIHGESKVKLSLCFNWAPRHEGVLGEWRYSSTHSLTWTLDGGEYRRYMKEWNVKTRLKKSAQPSAAIPKFVSSLSLERLQPKLVLKQTPASTIKQGAGQFNCLNVTSSGESDLLMTWIPADE